MSEFFTPGQPEQTEQSDQAESISEPEELIEDTEFVGASKQEVSKLFEIIKSLYDSYDNMLNSSSFSKEDPRLVELKAEIDNSLSKLKGMISEKKFLALLKFLKTRRERYSSDDEDLRIDGHKL